MAPARKRENRGNQYYDVGVQGRKTGITLEDKGVRDEYGLEPISGIFSSPEKSPPKRGASSRSTRGTVTESESMEIQESSLPDLTTSAHILRNSRTHLPPPRSRSPMKTALNSSPRRQSSMAPRAQSIGRSSPLHAVSHQAVNRVLDFEQDGSSLQDTPALSGSGQRRGKRLDIYDIETSPSRQQSPTLEESVLQEEITAMDNGVAEETFFARIGDDSIPPVEDADVSIEESEIVTEVVKVPAKRGRKRKSDAVESAAEDESNTSKTTKQSSTSARGQGAKKKRKSITQSRRSKRVSDTEQDASALTDASIDGSEQVIEPPPSLPRPRGRPPKAKKEAAKSAPRSTAATTDKADEPIFKKPKAIAKPKVRQETSKKNTPAQAMDREQNSSSGGLEAGKLVDAYGKPLSKSEIEQMSTTSVGSRYGRGRNLSVFRELDPDTVARVGRTGRHRVAPIDFWKNDRITYNHDGSMNSIVKNEEMEPQKRATRNTGKKGKKRGLKAIDEEDEVELDPWEEDEGLLIGNFREFDPINEVTSSDLMEGAIAWAEKGINPVDVPDASFKFAKLGSAGDESFLSWGFIELLQDHMKRSKNSRKMHMVFHVQQGTVEVKMHENEFVVHRGGVWQVPRGNTYSIRNIGNATARVFFAQAFETKIEVQE